MHYQLTKAQQDILMNFCRNNKELSPMNLIKKILNEQLPVYCNITTESNYGQEIQQEGNPKQ